MCINVRENIDPTFTTTTGFNSTFYIHLNNSFGYPQYLDAQSLPQTIELGERTKSLTINITDTSGVDVSLNGVEWEMLLRRTGKFIESVPVPPSKVVEDEGIPGRKTDSSTF